MSKNSLRAILSPRREETIAVNLLGQIRLVAALLPHLLTKPRGAILTVSSALAFVPFVATPTYCATKAAIHSYSMSLRKQLKNTGVDVIEIIPPYVQSHLSGEQQATDPNAMPVGEFADEVMRILTTQSEATEIVVERAKSVRYAAESGALDKVFAHVNSMEI